MATNRARWAGAGRRLIYFKWAVCAALLSEVMIAPKLWLANRPFPAIPVLSALPVLPEWLCATLAVLFISSVIVVALLANPGRWTLSPILFGSVLVLFDLNRLQPWVYEYLLMFAGLSLVDWTDPESPRSKTAVAVCGVIVISLYVWSGLQKFNLSFADQIFPWLLHPLGDRWVERLRPLWFVIPCFEMSVGALLFLPRTRAWGLAGAVTMHACILIAVGPLGQNANEIVWPWNLFMPILVVILFYRDDAPIAKAVWSAPLSAAVVILIGFLPALNFVDLWDGALSASFYSGRERDGWIYLTQTGVDQLPKIYRNGNPALALDAPGRYRLDITKWAEWAMNVPPYAEPRVYRAIVRTLEASGLERGEMALLVRDRPGIASRERAYSAEPIR